MQVKVLKVREIKTKTGENGKIRRYRSALIDYQDGIHAELKVLTDDVIKPEDVVVGMTADMRVDEKGFVTVFEKV